MIKNIFGFILSLLVGTTIFVFPKAALAQTQPTYMSPVDLEMTLKKVALFPLTDNLSGIYATPLSESLKARLSMDSRWTLIDPGAVRLELEPTPAQVQVAMKNLSVDGLLTGRIQKGPAGLNLRLTLYAGPQGDPLIIEETLEPKKFATEQVNELLAETLQRLRDRLPYHGTVASRRGQQITVNLGQNSGIKQGDVVDIIQILKVNRHPKLRFMISTEKEILGKARVFKADEELSFANLIYEKEAGVVVAGLKVMAPRPVLYPEPFNPANGSAPQSANSGEKPFEWLPEPTPQFGRFQILGGISQYQQTNNFETAGGVSGSSSIIPNLGLMAEGWLNKDWWVSLGIRQSSFSVKNDLPSSSPARINITTSKYDIQAGYNFLLGNDFFGPKLQLSLGMSEYSARADETTPLLFSKMKFGGMFVGANFITNLGEESPWDFGARMKYFLSPNASDSGDSGSIQSVSANDFGFIIGHRVRQNFRYLGELSFESYGNDFKNNGSRPDPVSSNSHKATALWFGLEYSF